MKPTKEQIQKYYSDALARCLSAYAQLDDKEWGKKASDKWTAKDYLAHLVVGQEEASNRVTRQAIAGQPGEIPGHGGREAINEYNQEMLPTANQLPVSELLGRLKASVGEHLSILAGLGEADLDRPVVHPAWSRPGTIRDLFFSSYLHLPGHYQDVRRVAKKKLPHWMDISTTEEVHYQLDRIFYFMPLIFRSDRGQGMEATYLFTMEGDGGGQWSIRIADGRAEAQDGVPEKADAEVRTKPALWIDLSTNDLNAPMAIMTRKVRINGNPALAMRLESLFQVS